MVRAAQRCGGHPLIVRPRRCQDVRHLADMRDAITRPGLAGFVKELCDELRARDPLAAAGPEAAYGADTHRVGSGEVFFLVRQAPTGFAAPFPAAQSS